MGSDGDWRRFRSGISAGAGRAGFGILRVSLLFGSAVIALALIATPYLERESRLRTAGAERGLQLDRMSTGSVGAAGETYTMRRSVLQASPRAVCIIRDNGSRSGDC